MPERKGAIHEVSQKERLLIMTCCRTLYVTPGKQCLVSLLVLSAGLEMIDVEININISGCH